MLTVGLLILGGLLYGVPSVGAASAGLAGVVTTVHQQQPVSTIPPIQPPRFSTIPPLPPTPAPVVATPTSVQVPIPVVQPTRVIPPLPTPLPPLPTVAPSSSQTAPRAGGFPLEVALLVFGVSVAVLGSGLFLVARSRPT